MAAKSMIRLRRIAFLLISLAATPAFAVSPVPVAGTKGMVVSAQRLASEVGAEVLRDGGNAVDAAVAVGYALAVVLPCCGNLGGGGFATLHLADGRDTFLNFREKAPGAATGTMYLDAAGNLIPDASLKGYKAVGVPGTVLGLETLRERYGRLPRERLIAPAIRLAEDGFVLTQGDADILAAAAKDFAAEPGVAAIFLKDGRPWRPDERLVQKELAATLRLISAGGADAFYKGAPAEAVAKASAGAGGLLTAKDFADYRVGETAPVRCSYRGYDIVSAPPPSSGGTTLCLILKVLEAYPMGDLGLRSAASIQLMVEAMRHAYVDRNFALGDPDFVSTPVERLLSSDHIAAIRARIVPGKAGSSTETQPGAPPHESTETTHYSVLDKDGNAVSVTYTINANFGARVIAPGTGFFLNDEMDDFTTKPGAANLFGLVQGKKNAIAPGKRPLSSMSPTVVLKDGDPVMVIGSPGGSRIITITLEAIMNVIDYGLDPQEAVDAPRVHHQWMPDQIFVEKGAVSADTAKALTDMGYTIVEQTPWGAAEMIYRSASRLGLFGDGPAAPAGSVYLGIRCSDDPRQQAVLRTMFFDFTRTAKAISGNPARLPFCALYGANDNRRPAGAAVAE